MDEQRLKDLIGGEYSEKFTLYKELLQEYGKMFNITSVLDDGGIFYRHFLDSIAGEEYFFGGADVAEVGSGGGFPSIPLKIIREDLKFTLMESTGKKCAFLQTVVDKLGLNGVQVLNVRAEDAGRDERYRQKFGVCCARAVARLNVLAEYCLPFVEEGGRFIAYKGDCADEIAGAKNAIKILGGEIEDIVGYNLQNCGKRTLVIVRKIAPTPFKYPRGNAKVKKNPL